MTKVISLRIRNRAAAALFIFALLAAGALLLTVGFALLLGLVVAGGLVGAGVAAYRAIRGKRPALGGRGADGLRGHANGRLTGLDPSLEVTAPQTTVVRRIDGVDSQP